MLPLFGVGWWRYGLLKGMRREEGKEKGNKGKPFFFFFFLLPLLETFLQRENTKSAQYKGLPLKRGTLQSSLS